MVSTRCFLRTDWFTKALLLLGLFGLIVGQAHACVQYGLQQSAGGMPSTTQQSTHESHDCDAAVDSCESLCDASQSLLPKSEPQRWLDGAAWLPPMPAFAVAWAVDRSAAQRRPQTRFSPPRLAVALRFLRLTL